MLPMIYMALIDDDDLPQFEELYEKYRQEAYYSAFNILHNEALAEECVSEAFLAVARNFKKVNNLETHKQLKYVVICSENSAKDKIKKEKVNVNNEEYDDEFFTDTSYDEYDMLFWKECIRKLNKTDMEILYLRCILQLDYKEICKSLNISYEAARARVSAARNNLKKIIEKEDSQ